MSDHQQGKPYDRRPSDTEMSWVAFGDFLTMEKPRGLRRLHNLYISPDVSKKPPTKSYPTLKRWCHRDAWIERATAYDADQGALRLSEVSAAQRKEESIEISRYSQIHRDYGVGGIQLCMAILKKMSDYAKNGVPSDYNPDDPDGKFRITSLADMNKAAGIIAKIQPGCSEQWARAVGIDEIMELWNEQQTGTDET